MSAPARMSAEPEAVQVAASYLCLLYGEEARGHLALFTVPGEETLWVPASDPAGAAREAVGMADTKNVYYGHGLHPVPLGPKQRGTAKTVSAIPGLSLDVDFGAAGHKKDKLPPTRRDAEALIREFALPPTAIVSSGHGLQPHWLFKEPWHFGGDAEREDAADLAYRFHATMAEKARAHGWVLDSTHSLAQVYRVPGTWNRKPGLEPVQVRIVELDEGARYSPEDFEPYLLDVEWAARNGRAVESVRLPADLPRVPLSILRMPEWLRKLIREGRDPERHESRSEAQWSALNTLIEIRYDDTSIAGIFFDRENAIGEKARERGRAWFAADLARAKAASANSAISGNCANAPAPWEPPLPFAELDRPSFPTHALRAGWLREWVEAEAEATQTPPDLAGMLSQAALSAACARKAEVRIRDGWTEPLNDYFVVSLPSGERKTRVFSDTTAPLEAFEEEEARRMGPELAEAQNRYKIAEKALERAQAEAAKAKDDRLGLTMEADRLARELASMKVPVLPRLIVDDCSPERLATLLRDQGGRIAAMSPEGDIFDLMAGRYSANGSPNLGVYLKGHAGDTLRVDRVGRPPEYVKGPALTLGLAVQPEVIRGLASRPGFRGRGLLARLRYGLPQSLLGSRNTRALPVPPSVRAAFEQHILTLLKLPMGTDADGNPAPHVLTLDAEAREAFERFEAEVEPRLGELGDLGHMTDWGGKLVGAVARWAGRQHLAVLAGHPAPWEIPIDGSTALAAIELGHYLTAHAKAAFAEMGADPVIEDARYMLRWIAQRGAEAFTKREAFEGTKGRFKKVDMLEPALRLLAEHGYIRERPGPDQQGRGRPASPTYDVNPLWGSQNSHYSQKSNCANTANSANGRATSESGAGGDWEEGEL